MLFTHHHIRTHCTDFLGAKTITHELGHYFANSRGGFNPATGEPFVGEAVGMELGLGFISWLFGGWHPEPITHTGHKGDPDFSQGQIWKPWHQRGATKQHRGTGYSMRLEHIEKIMDQASWEGQPVDSKPGLVREKLLHAPSFGPGKCARISRGITSMNGAYGWDEGAWYALHFYSMPLAISIVSALHFLVVFSTYQSTC